MNHSNASGRDAHHEAMHRYLDTAAAIAPSRWNEPLAPGKWSPAQVTEHLRLSYTAVVAELNGRSGLRPRVSWWMTRILRLRYLQGILRTGTLPRNVKAPREVRPAEGPFEQVSLIAALEEQSDTFERALGERADPGPVVTHHLLGRFDAHTAWRFLTVHTEHHRRQLVAQPAEASHDLDR